METNKRETLIFIKFLKKINLILTNMSRFNLFKDGFKRGIKGGKFDISSDLLKKQGKVWPI